MCGVTIIFCDRLGNSVYSALTAKAGRAPGNCLQTESLKDSPGVHPASEGTEPMRSLQGAGPAGLGRGVGAARGRRPPRAFSSLGALWDPLGGALFSGVSFRRPGRGFQGGSRVVPGSLGLSPPASTMLTTRKLTRARPDPATPWGHPGSGQVSSSLTPMVPGPHLRGAYMFPISCPETLFEVEAGESTAGFSEQLWTQLTSQRRTETPEPPQGVSEHGALSPPRERTKASDSVLTQRRKQSPTGLQLCPRVVRLGREVNSTDWGDEEALGAAHPFSRTFPSSGASRRPGPLVMGLKDHQPPSEQGVGWAGPSVGQADKAGPGRES